MGNTASTVTDLTGNHLMRLAQVEYNPITVGDRTVVVGSLLYDVQAIDIVPVTCLTSLLSQHCD